MNWEEDIARRGKHYKDKEERKDQDFEKILQNAEKIIHIAKKYNARLASAGITVHEEISCGWSSPKLARKYDSTLQVNYSHHGVDGKLSIHVADNNWPVTYKKYNGYRIFITYSAHSCQKSLVRRSATEHEIFQWIKFATRQPALLDRLRKLFGAYHGQI